MSTLAYIDAGTAAAVAAVATGGIAGVKAAAQSFVYKRRSKGSTVEPKTASAAVGADS